MKPEGIYVPSITPFDEKGDIMFDALGKLIDFWAGAGVSGLVVNASTGEALYMTREEKRRIIDYAIERVPGKCKVFAGTAALSTRETIELTQDALDAGAEAALITTPFFYKPTREETAQYFVDVIDAVDLPVILYNVPKFTGYSVEPKTVATIAEECSGLVAMKDSSGNPGTMAEVIRLCGDKISCLSGSADMVLPTLNLGGKGAIIAVANAIPLISVNLYKSWREGDVDAAGEGQRKASYVNKVLVLDYPQIAAIKAALNDMGYDAGAPRRPLLPLPREAAKKVAEAMSLLSSKRF
ncbi:MAG TPA: dihydrodipicolinate synthase family protein [Candidatus Bathyarchaeia archaeon]